MYTDENGVPYRGQTKAAHEKRVWKRNKQHVAQYHALLGKKEQGVEIEGKGAKKHRLTPGKAVEPFLTANQRARGYVRTSRKMGRVMQIMEDTGMTMAEFVEGLSIEELVRGQIMNKNGHFGGRPMKWIPREFHRACLHELMRRGKDMWQSNYLEAIQAMTDIAAGRGAGIHATPGERIKAAIFVIERMEGKVPERLVVTEEKRWAVALDGIVAEVSDAHIAQGRKALESAEHSLDILEAEVVDEEDYDIDDDAPARTPPEPSPQPRSRRRK